ncbi:MAG: hypothetical protein PVJ43_01320 [Gemmatimonadales bacterium]|jgi:hypothetical protein
MMSDPSSVDGSTVDELTGKVVLLIDESRPWHDATSMHRELSAKVKHYVRYIRSPSFAGEYGQRPQDTIVRLVSQQPPAEATLEFFRRISYELHKNGIDFEYQVGEDGIPVLLGPGIPVAPPPVAAVPPEPPSAPSTVDDRRAEEVWEAKEYVREAEAEEPGIDAELAAEIEEVLDTLEAGPAEPSAARELDEATAALDSEEPESREVAEISEPPELSAAVEPASVSPADEPPDSAPGPTSQEQVEAELPGDDDWQAEYVDEGPSELELLIEAPDDVASRFIGVDEPPEQPVAAAPDEIEEPPPESEQTHPPFFPEEEFGRSLPPQDDVETLLRGVEAAPLEAAIIETSSGKRIRLDAQPAAAKPTTDESQPSLGRAVGAAVGAAIIGAVAWAALSIPAAQGASPLALAVALMVGMSVRLRGAGRTDAFRLVGCLGTILGSALGALLATAALTGWVGGQGLEGVVNLFVDPASLWAAIDTYFDPIDLVSLVIALYIAFKISATRPAD